MASLWIEFRGQPAKKLVGHLRRRDAEAALERYWRAWVAKGPAYSADEADGYVRLKEGAHHVCGMAWVEYLSPPSAPEEGQPKRQQGAA